MLGNKEIMANNIKYYMNKFDIDRNKLCSDLNLKYMTVSDWINAKTYPRIDKIELLAHYFGINKADLVEVNSDSKNDITTIYNQLTSLNQKKVFTYAEHQLATQQENTVNEDTFNVTNIYNHKKENIEAEENVIPFPIYGATGAGVGEEIYDDVLYEEININVNDLPKDAEFGILVNGDSMEPMFDKGSYAFVSKQNQVLNNTIALVVLNNAALIKKVVFNDKTVKLVSINPYYDDIYVRDNDNFRVVGRIVM